VILFSASYRRGTPSADLRAYKVCEELARRGAKADIAGPGDSTDYRAKVAALRPKDVLYVQKWAGPLHGPEIAPLCRGKIVYDFDDLTSSRRHAALLGVCHAAVVGTRWLASQTGGKPTLVAPTPIEPRLFGEPIPYAERQPAVVVAKYGMKPYLGKLAKLAPRLNDALRRHGHRMWFLGAHRPAEYQRLREMYPGCLIYPLVKMPRFYEVQVPIIKVARWGFVPYDRRCRGKSATSLLTMMACGVPVQAFAFGECEEMLGPGLRRWAVRGDDRFFENAERLMSDPAQGEMFVRAARRRVEMYSLAAHCDRLTRFLEGLGATL
jgi:glycosyltransferase involved in cell wall biosynthesis